MNLLQPDTCPVVVANSAHVSRRQLIPVPQPLRGQTAETTGHRMQRWSRIAADVGIQRFARFHAPQEHAARLNPRLQRWRSNPEIGGLSFTTTGDESGPERRGWRRVRLAAAASGACAGST